MPAVIILEEWNSDSGAVREPDRDSLKLNPISSAARHSNGLDSSLSLVKWL
jgi:hypothetical protein